MGGLVGRNYDSISNSFSTSRVTNEKDTGGLTGSAGTISNSYWDITLTEQATCYDGGSTNCTSTDNNISWYYYSTNAPLSSWNFTTIWQENSGAYPTLR